MNILISNDDGIDAPGLAALESVLGQFGTTWVVAPDRERSAQSHTLTMHKPLFAKPRGPRRFAVSGTPADCVYMATYGLLPERADLVVSGINRGANIGHDVHYSGTVAAAREGSLQGIPSLSVSLAYLDVPKHYDTAAALAARVVERMLSDGVAEDCHLNLNVPDLPLDQVRGIRPAPLGRRTYGHLVETRTDPRGRTYYWIGGPPLKFTEDGERDGPVVQAGFAALTPLSTLPTDVGMLERLRDWF